MSYQIQLRDYQEECLENIFKEAEAGIRRQLITLPTGSGKTILMSALAKEFNRKTLILAHREELITQTLDKLKLFWPDAKVGICKAERDEIQEQIVIGSVQTCSRPHRLERLKEQGFELLMIDEAHHSIANSYQSIISERGFFDDNNGILVGVTATPKDGLGNIFEKITFSRSISTMIKSGYLSPVVGRKILTNFSFEKIRTINGDFSLEDLSEAVNTSERNNFIVEKFKTYAPNRKGIAFCVDVQHCKDLASAFKSSGINAIAVYGEMNIDERKIALDGLKSGEFQIVTSCGILTEGFDEPSIDVVLMARPTKSSGLYIQCIGRGLRKHPGKEDCLVLDFTDRGHNLDSVMILSKTMPEAVHFKENDENKVDEEEEEREEIDRTPKINVLEDCDREFDILGSARFVWVSIGDDEWSLIDDEKREIIMKPSGDGYVATLYFPDGDSWKIIQKPIPIEYCSGVCEDYARKHLKIALANLNAAWMKEKAPPTLGQCDFLEKNGISCEEIDKAQASIEIRKIIAMRNKDRRKIAEEPITQKQEFFLKANGVRTKGMTKFAAMQAISKIKKAEAKQEALN